MHELINVAFYIQFKSGYYLKKHNQIINKMLNYRYTMINCRNQIKMKHKDFYMIRKK